MPWGGVRHVDNPQIPPSLGPTQCDSRSLSSRSILHGPAKHGFDFRLCHAVAVDVRLPSLRIDVVPDAHAGMLAPSQR